jgi:hypothetical protein
MKTVNPTPIGSYWRMMVFNPNTNQRVADLEVRSSNATGLTRMLLAATKESFQMPSGSDLGAELGGRMVRPTNLADPKKYYQTLYFTSVQIGRKDHDDVKVIQQFFKLTVNGENGHITRTILNGALFFNASGVADPGADDFHSKAQGIATVVLEHFRIVHQQEAKIDRLVTFYVLTDGIWDMYYRLTPSPTVSLTQLSSDAVGEVEWQVCNPKLKTDEITDNLGTTPLILSFPADGADKGVFGMNKEKYSSWSVSGPGHFEVRDTNDPDHAAANGRLGDTVFPEIVWTVLSLPPAPGPNSTWPIGTIVGREANDRHRKDIAGVESSNNHMIFGGLCFRAVDVTGIDQSLIVNDPEPEPPLPQ